MKEIELSAYGVEEMDQKELIIVNGGVKWFYWLELAFTLVCGDFLEILEALQTPVGYRGARFKLQAGADGHVLVNNPDGTTTEFTGIAPYSQVEYEYYTPLE